MYRKSRQPTVVSPQVLFRYWAVWIPDGSVVVAKCDREQRGSSSRFLFYGKDNERRAQYQAKSLLLSVGIAEPPPVLLKDSERRAQWQMLGKGIVYMR